MDSMVKRDNETDHDRIGSACGKRSLRVGLVMVVLALVLQGSPALAADEYEPSDAGFPLRVIAYVVNPVGVVLDYLILRPAYWLGSHEPFRTVFGRTD